MPPDCGMMSGEGGLSSELRRKEGGRITPEPLAATRGEDGRWIGGSVQQWVDELTAAVLDHHAAGFIYRSPDDTPADEALARWATEIVPAVREAITR